MEEEAQGEEDGRLTDKSDCGLQGPTIVRVTEGQPTKAYYFNCGRDLFPQMGQYVRDCANGESPHGQSAV